MTTSFAPLPLTAPASKEVEANGVKLAYVDEGRGEPIVFVHGAVADNRVWEPIREAIAAKHRFIAPTLRYFGTGAWTDAAALAGVNHDGPVRDPAGLATIIADFVAKH
jgi:pimeloyl-ACP methyl ester carboxylesterase